MHMLRCTVTQLLNNLTFKPHVNTAVFCTVQGFINHANTAARLGASSQGLLHVKGMPAH